MLNCNNYDVLFDSRLANRFYNEIKKDLELELESELMLKVKQLLIRFQKLLKFPVMKCQLIKLT